jgi:hypothetical protein
MDADFIIYGGISLIIGLILIPVMANFSWEAQNNSSVRAISGLSNVVPLVMYGFAFCLVGVGIGLIVIGLKKNG